MNNAIFGKSMENVLNRSNIKLINNNPEKLLKLIKQSNFQNVYQISNRLALVESKPIKTTFNKPIYLGACIFETSKLQMYEFWYVHLKEKYNDKVELIYTDIDSFVIQVKTDDIYNNMLEDSHLYDFSEYPKNHPNCSLTNKKVLGKFKDELNGKILTEFCSLKPKMYSDKYIDNYKDMLENWDLDEYELIKSKMHSNEYIDNYTIINKNKHKGIKTVIDLKHNEYTKELYIRKQ